MKKALTLFLFLMCIFAGSAFGDVFASRFKVTNPDGSAFDGNVTDGSGAKLWYYLNDTAASVAVKVIKVSDGSTVATINATNLGPASNPQSATWDGSGTAAGEKYYFSVSATGPVGSATDYTMIKFIKTYEIMVGGNSKNIYTRGVDANIYMNTRGFGNLYASNSDGSDTRLRTGVLRFNADASYYGSEADDPMLTQTLGTVNTGGTFDWTGLSPWYATVDQSGKIFVSGNGSGGKVYEMKNDTVAPKAFLGGLENPRGISVVGTGANRKIYVAVDTAVWRIDLGDADTASSAPVLVASFGIYVRDVLIDDAGHMIVALRDHPDGSGPSGYIERYDISSGLPKTRGDAEWSQTFATGLPIGLSLYRGQDWNSASDDTLYASVRGGTSSDNETIGLWELTKIDDAFGITAKHFFYPNQFNESIGGNISANADLTVDYAGNVILFENGNEEIFIFSPPHAGAANTEVTHAIDTISVSGASSVSRNGAVPQEFSLNQNYPNPFNPSTVISYSMPDRGRVDVQIYDLLGNLVTELYHGEAGIGYNAVQWNGTNLLGAKVSSGMYIYRVTAALNDGRSFTDAKRMMLLK